MYSISQKSEASFRSDSRRNEIVKEKLTINALSPCWTMIPSPSLPWDDEKVVKPLGLEIAVDQRSRVRAMYFNAVIKQAVK